MRHRSLLLLALALPLLAEDAPIAFPDMAPSVGAVLERDYYDRSRFKPRVMVERALRALEGAEISIDTRWDADRVVLQIGESEERIVAPEPATLGEAMTLIERVRLALEASQRFPAKQTRDISYAMLNGALASLDPHTVLMPPEPAGDFDEDIRGEFGGIGAYLNQDPQTSEITIERVMPDRPAEKAGVQDGDVIIGVDGESTVGLALDQAVRRIKGPKGTTVTLSLKRKNQVLDLQIVRDLVQVVTIRSWRQGGIGYVRMDEFNQNTARDLLGEILKLVKEAPIKGLVLDLRANGGGLLEQARIISDFFLPKNQEIVRTVTVGGEPQIYRSSPKQAYDGPMLVLVGSGSASAAEILAGALQRNDRAVVAGAPTFGKGSVQSIRPLRDSSRLKLTIQEYQLAGGVSIQDVGVTPDLRLVRHIVRSDGSVDMVPYTAMREQDDEFALGNDHAYQHAASLELGWLAQTLGKDELRRSAMSSRDYRPDQEAMVAVELMAQALDTPEAAALPAEGQRQALIEALKAPVQRRIEHEATILAKAFADQKPAVTWGPDAAPPEGALTLRFDGPAEVEAGTRAELRFTVANAGTVAAGRLYGVVRADKASPLYEDEVVFGAVAAGGETLGTLRLDVPPRAYAGEEHFTVELYRDGHREPLARLPVAVAVRGKPRPHFAYAWSLKEPSGDAAIQPGEACALEVTLSNIGEGSSAPVSLSVYKDNDPWVKLGGGSFKLDPLAPGASTTVSVPLTVLAELSRQGRKEAFANASVALQFTAEERFDEETDARYRAQIYHKLTLPVNRPAEGRRIEQPRLALQEVKPGPDGARLVTVRVADDAGAWIAAFLDEAKVDLRSAKALGDGLYQVAIPPRAGVSTVRIVATDQDEVSEMLPVRLWMPEPAGATPVAQQKPPAIAKPEIEPVVP